MILSTTNEGDNQMTEQEYWNEMFEIQQDLKNQGFHK